MISVDTWAAHYDTTYNLPWHPRKKWNMYRRKTTFEEKSGWFIFHTWKTVWNFLFLRRTIDPIYLANKLCDNSENKKTRAYLRQSQELISFCRGKRKIHHEIRGMGETVYHREEGDLHKIFSCLQFRRSKNIFSSDFCT